MITGDLAGFFATTVRQIAADLTFFVRTFTEVVGSALSLIPFIGDPIADFIKSAGKKITGVIQRGAQIISDFLISAAPVINFFSKWTPTNPETLKKLGFSDKAAQYISQAITTVALTILTGGNVAVALAVTAVSIAIQEIGPRIGLSPGLTAALSIAASAVAGAATNAFGTSTTVFQALKDAAPNLAANFAQAGLVAIGEAVGLDPRITSLIGVPVGASIGGLVGGIGSSQGIFNSIKDSLFSSGTLGNLVSVGASIGLGAVGAPPLLQNVIPGILGQLTAGGSGSTGGGGGPGYDSSLLQAGKNLLVKIGDVASRLGSRLVRGTQNVINFGAQLISDGWEATKTFFSGILSRQTQEVMYQASVAGGIGGGTGALDVGFELISQTIEEDSFGNIIKVTEYYGNDAGDAATIIGDGLGNKISVERNIAGKTFSETYENLGKNASELAVLSGAAITEKIGDNLQARYLFNDGLFRQVDYVDIDAQQTLSRIQADNSNKGLQFDEKGNLLTGILENFFTGTAYAYEAGQLMATSIIRKDPAGVFTLSSVFDPVKKQVETVYNMTAAGVGALYNTQIELYDRYLDATSAGAHALRQFLDEVLNIDGAEAKVYNSTNILELHPGVSVVDMKLDYYKFLLSGNLQDFDNLAADLIFDVANRRWRQGIAEGVPRLREQMSNPSNKIIITPGVNSGLKLNGVGDGFTPDEINALAATFTADGKRVMISHSAGTEAQLKAILEAKQQNIPLPDKFVFFSPRVSRDQFEWFIDQAGLSPNQVLVVTADGDFPHYPTDLLSNEARLSGAVSADFPNFMSIYYDYENSRGNYNYLFLEKDYGTPSYLKHGGMIEGAIYDHEYDVKENGTPRKEQLRVLYSEFMDK